MNVLWPISRHAAQTPDKIAAIDDHGQYSYGQLAGGAERIADHIKAFSDTAHVGILLPTGGAFPMAMLGIWLAQRTAVPLNYLLLAEELAHVIRDSQIDTILTTGALLDDLAGAHSSGGVCHTKWFGPGINLLRIDQLNLPNLYRSRGNLGGELRPQKGNIRSLSDQNTVNAYPMGMPSPHSPPPYHGQDLAVILYTSGTSGRPKGVMLTHDNLRSNVDAAAEHAQLTEADTFLGVLPQFHSFGLTALTLLPLRIGATSVYAARFVPKKVVGLIRRHRPHVFMAVPSMYGALLTVKDAKPDDFSSIRLAVSGGEPLPQAIYDQAQNRWGLRLLEGYGLTETAPMTHWCTPSRHKASSVGTALPGVTVAIVDQHDQPLPAGCQGEVLISGPNVMRGYHKLPEQTQQVFVKLNIQCPADRTRSVAATSRQQFFRTGDIGRVDDDGFLFITGRKKEMLIIAGENVFPRQIEEILNRHPAVRDSAVIGKPDGLRGELPIAYVETADLATFDAATLRSWCRQHLAGYKVPREIHAVEQLPRSGTGKILRRKLPCG